MNQQSRRESIWLVLGLALGLLFMGALRWGGVHPGVLTPFAGLATPGYVLITVFFTIRLVRAGLPLDRLGFGIRLDRRQILLALAAIAVLRLADIALSPVIEDLLASERNLERFSDVKGSVASFVALLIMNWTLAAFGEEFAYRMVLMRGIAWVLGDTRPALITAVVLQAVLFGLIHAYQGPAGVVGSAISGLVFGTVTLASRWSIWPAAIAHGTNNTFGIVSLYLG